MRSSRLGLILLAIYFVFLGGSAYYGLIFAVRVFHHAFVTLLLVWWLARRIRRNQGLPQTPLNLPLYLAVGVWFISAILSIDSRMAFEHLWFPLTHTLFFFVLVDLFQRGRGRMVLEAQFFVGALIVLLTGLELASWYFGLGIIPGMETGWVNVAPLPLRARRVALAMNISTLLAGYVAPLITLVIGWALTARRDYRQALWLLAACLLAVLIFTFSRGGLLSVMAGIGVLVVMRLTQIQRLTRVIPARALIGLAGVGGAAVVILLIVVSASPARQSGDEGRLDMWRGAIEMTRDHPLTGVGTGLFGRSFRDYRTPDQARDKFAAAHNAYLNTGAETGLTGLVVSALLGIIFLRTWWKNWRAAESEPGRRIRLEAALAALIGLGIHSLVDTFTITPIVLLMALLVAYCISVPRAGFEAPPTHPRLTSVVALLIVAGYGVWFIPLDLAQARYQASLSSGEGSIEQAQAAAALDPALNLYPLQVAYLRGGQMDDIAEAIAAYEAALQLEPTWDVGWLNLAALAERHGDLSTALAAVDRARQINPLTSATLHWARLAEVENAASDEAIIASYGQYLTNVALVSLPLSDFWAETDLRTQAVEQLLDQIPVDRQYRVLAVHDPDRAAALVPAEPTTAAEWWVVGEHALRVESDAEQALTAFDQAIQILPANGDLYVSRARAQVQNGDSEAAQRDLDIAGLLGTTFEYPNAVRAQITESQPAADQWRVNALPPLFAGQELAAVLYSRPATFEILEEMRPPGPGRAAMQPWYELAEGAQAAGQIQDAINIYRAIIRYAPGETDARNALNQLVDEPAD
jgi:O-antigen ligase/tetratricopeptide (TPR) repeat protein